MRPVATAPEKSIGIRASMPGSPFVIRLNGGLGPWTSLPLGSS